MFGTIGIFVCKTGRNAAHFSQTCWGHDVKICLHPFDVNNFGGRTFGKDFWGELLGPLVSLCVKQGEMLPIFLSIVGAMMSRFVCLHSMLIIFGDELLGNNLLGGYFGAIGIFVCKAGGNAARFFLRIVVATWMISIIFLHPFDGKNSWGRLFK